MHCISVGNKNYYYMFPFDDVIMMKIIIWLILRWQQDHTLWQIKAHPLFKINMLDWAWTPFKTKLYSRYARTWNGVDAAANVKMELPSFLINFAYFILSVWCWFYQDQAVWRNKSYEWYQYLKVYTEEWRENIATFQRVTYRLCA